MKVTCEYCESVVDAEKNDTCPNCGAVVTVDEETLLSQDLTCPNCHAAFDIEIKDEEDEDDKQE